MTDGNLIPFMWRRSGESHACYPAIDSNYKPAEGETVVVIEDAGSGPYAVMSCDEVSWDDVDEFDAWVASIRSVVASTEAKKETAQ